MIIEHKIKKTLSIPITCPHKYYLPLLNVEVSWSIEGAQSHFATFARLLFKDEDVKCQMYDVKLFCFFSSRRHFCYLDRGSRFHIKWVVLGFMFSKNISSA